MKWQFKKKTRPKHTRIHNQFLETSHGHEVSTSRHRSVIWIYLRISHNSCPKDFDDASMKQAT